MIPKALGCPRCQAAVDSQDKFCQQCGLLLAEPRAQLTCPHCAAAYDNKGNLCQSCGRFLVAVNLQVKNVSRCQPLADTSSGLSVSQTSQPSTGSQANQPPAAAAIYQATQPVSPVKVVHATSFAPATPAAPAASAVAFAPGVPGVAFASAHPSAFCAAPPQPVQVLPAAVDTMESQPARGALNVAPRSLPPEILEQKLIESANEFLLQNAQDGSFEEPAGQSLLHSPLLNPRSMPGLLNSAGKSEVPPGENLGQSLFRPLVDLSLGLVMVAYTGALVWWLADQSNSITAAASVRATAQAQGALSSSRHGEAVAIMDKLAVGKMAALTADERRTFDAALLEAGKSNFEKGKYRFAMVDLFRVTPGSAGYAEARQMLDTCLKQTAESVATNAGSRSRNLPPEGRIVTKTAIAAASETTHAGAVPKPEFADADVAQYNNLLANYFARQQAGGGQAGQDGHVPNPAAVAEPPSLKEWVEQGRADF